MPDLKLAECDNCGVEERYGWGLPLGSGWRSLKHRGDVLLDITERDEKMFCSLECVSVWAGKRARVEERA